MQDNDYNYRHDQNVVTTNNCRKEIEDLRFLLNEQRSVPSETRSVEGSKNASHSRERLVKRVIWPSA